METTVMVLGGWYFSDFWLGITIQNSKTLFPLIKVEKSYFFWKLMKNWIEWHHWRCHGGGSVHFKVNEARKRVRNENCHQDAIQRNIEPKPSQQIPFRTPFKDIAEDFRVLGDFVWKLVEKCCSKTCVNFGRCYGNQGWAETVENQMLFFQN